MGEYACTAAGVDASNPGVYNAALVASGSFTLPFLRRRVQTSDIHSICLSCRVQTSDVHSMCCKVYCHPETSSAKLIHVSQSNKFCVHCAARPE